MAKTDRVILIIMDGWGIGKGDETDAIANANTPYIDSLYSNVPNTTLTTFGNAVGLPEGQMGNSEVGHLNIGSGRVVWQQLALINKAFKEGSINHNPVLINAIEYAKHAGKSVHFIGLLSNGGVHSSIEHLKGLCALSSKLQLEKVFVHAFTDGRDCDPKSGFHFVEELQNTIRGTTVRLASIIGRYYAMDRDKRWGRTKKAYYLMVHGEGEKITDPLAYIRKSYEDGITDEFILPAVCIDENENPVGIIEEGDVVINFNFRTDRGRQISTVLTQQNMHEFNMHILNIRYITMTEYDDTYKNVEVLFKGSNIQKTLGEVISNLGLQQIRAAETEKYPHVTFFFSGGREEPFAGEKRILIPSPQVATYDMKPEMSAEELTSAVLDEVAKREADFICLNFANPDMVGHTGDFEAIIRAVEKVDSCVQRIVEEGRKNEFQFIIIADHGNADEARNPDGSPNTAHSKNPVPCFIISDKCDQINHTGVLADIAPTVLKLMNIPIPDEMDGKPLC